MKKQKKMTSEEATKTWLDDTTILKVLQALSKTSARDPMTRTDLCYLCHCPDREVREAIEILRENAVPICSTSGQAGYWYGTDDEYEKYVIGEDKARIKKMQKRHKAWKNRPLDGQMKM